MPTRWFLFLTIDVYAKCQFDNVGFSDIDNLSTEEIEAKLRNAIQKDYHQKIETFWYREVSEKEVDHFEILSDSIEHFDKMESLKFRDTLKVVKY